MWNDTNKTCDKIVIFGRRSPLYSYVYTFENRTVFENITYPEYNIRTTRKNDSDDDVYQEQEYDNCPCDLENYETGEKEINKIIKTAVESAVE